MRHAEVLEDRVDQALRVVAPVRRVDPRLRARAGDVDVEVAGKRQHGDAVGVGVDAQHHDRVAALAHPFAVAERPGVRRVGIDAGAVVGAGDEEVLGLRVGFRERGGRCRRSTSSCRRAVSSTGRPVVAASLRRRSSDGAEVRCRSTPSDRGRRPHGVGDVGAGGVRPAAAATSGGILEVDDVALADDDVAGDQCGGDEEADQRRRERCDDGETLGPGSPGAAARVISHMQPAEATARRWRQASVAVMRRRRRLRRASTSSTVSASARSSRARLDRRRSTSAGPRTSSVATAARWLTLASVFSAADARQHLADRLQRQSLDRHRRRLRLGPAARRARCRRATNSTLPRRRTGASGRTAAAARRGPCAGRGAPTPRLASPRLP